MAIEYIVTITRVEKDVPYVSHEWRKVVDEPDEEHPEIYRYVDTDATKDVASKVFEQTVDDLNMEDVIKAVNGI